jgi:hypothetical protein
MSIDSNASLSLIAERLSRTLTAIRKKLRDLGYKAESLGGFKVKEVAEMLLVPPGRVKYWVEQQKLLTKGGRITDSSLSKFFAENPKQIPYETLSPDMRSWLREMGYPADEQSECGDGGPVSTRIEAARKRTADEGSMSGDRQQAAAG